MKKKEAEEIKSIRAKSSEELLKDIQGYRDLLWNLKKDLSAGKVKNVKEIKRTKKVIARNLTILTWNKNHAN